jgi:glutaminyl-peptide cyclotransferase
VTIRSVKLLGIVLAVQVALGLTLVALVATDNLPFTGDGDADGSPAPTRGAAVDRFDGAAAFRLLRRQVELGPRPAGSPESRRLARLLRRIVPRGRYQEVPGGLRNVIGTVRGRERGYIVVGAHYDTKDIPGFVGANDGASGTAVALQLAREIEPRTIRPTLLFVFFDGEESPPGSDSFLEDGLRGSKVAARRFADRVDRMVLLDFVGENDLSIAREEYSSRGLWRKLRRAAGRAGTGATFPQGTQSGILDDHIPFIQRGVPAIDLIDFDFDCWHKPCDDLSAVSEDSLDRVGETVMELLPRL